MPRSTSTCPVFVSLGYLPTADYGDVHPEIRLYDTDRLLAAGRSRAAWGSSCTVSCADLSIKTCTGTNLSGI